MSISITTHSIAYESETDKGEFEVSLDGIACGGTKCGIKILNQNEVSEILMFTYKDPKFTTDNLDAEISGLKMLDGKKVPTPLLEDTKKLRLKIKVDLQHYLTNKITEYLNNQTSVFVKKFKDKVDDNFKSKMERRTNTLISRIDLSKQQNGYKIKYIESEDVIKPVMSIGDFFCGEPPNMMKSIEQIKDGLYRNLYVQDLQLLQKRDGSLVVVDPAKVQESYEYCDDENRNFICDIKDKFNECGDTKIDWGGLCENDWSATVKNNDDNAPYHVRDARSTVLAQTNNLGNVNVLLLLLFFKCLGRKKLMCFLFVILVIFSI
jgi:hypothetical protein